MIPANGNSIGNRQSAIPSHEVLDHQESVVAACVVARHSPHDLVSEVEIESLGGDVRCSHFETDCRYSAAEKTLFDLMHQSPAVSKTSMFRGDPQCDYVSGAIGLNHSDDKRNHLIARRDNFMANRLGV